MKKEKGYAQNKDTSSTKSNNAKMKTKDFIKMLQEADPSGEAYIRMPGGIPYAAEQKAGYWDGPYSYIDENGNYVYSIADYKVDIYCTDIEDFVYENYDMHTEGRNKWEDIKSKFKFELGGYCIKEHRDERANGILQTAEEAFNNCKEMHQNFFDKALIEMIDNAKKGWTWFQNKAVDDNSLKPNMHKYYTWKICDETGMDKGSNIHNTESVMFSGKFERLDNHKKQGYYEWKLIE